jgi:uncharacterized protein YcfL
MRYVLLLLPVLMIAGCGVRPPIEPRQDPYAPGQVHVTSSELRRHTAVGAPVPARDESGLLYVTVPIRSARNQQLHVDYRATFFDRNGQEIQRTGWMTKVLAPNVPDQIQVNSTSPRAANFQVDLRYAQ